MTRENRPLTEDGKVTRRRFLGILGGAAVGVIASACAAPTAAPPAAAPTTAPAAAAPTTAPAAAPTTAPTAAAPTAAPTAAAKAAATVPVAAPSVAVGGSRGTVTLVHPSSVQTLDPNIGVTEITRSVS